MYRDISQDAAARSAELAGGIRLERRRGVMPPSRRAIRGVLEWIDQAQTIHRVWGRNGLVLVGILSALLLLALRFGLLSP